MQKKRLEMLEWISTRKIIAVFIINAAIPIFVIWLTYMYKPYWKLSGLSLEITAGILAGLITLLLNVAAILYPYQKLKEQMLHLANSAEEDTLRQLTLNSQLGRILERIITNYNKNASDGYQLEALRQQAELMALQSQINPHFLYNTLDSIRGVALINGIDQIADMTESLAKLFRCMIANESMMIPLREELQSVKNYMLIQQFRFNGRISYQMSIDDSIMLYEVPNLIIQPVVENAVIHGLEHKIDGGVVSVSGYTTERRLVILVEDDGVGIAHDKLDSLNGELKAAQSQINQQRYDGKRGIALKNINQRIKLRFGNEYGLSIMSTVDVSTTVEIVLPAIPPA